LVVDAILDLLVLFVFATCVIALAAGMTWVVVKVSPAPDKKRRESQAS
jgi:hypothetical protein